MVCNPLLMTGEALMELGLTDKVAFITGASRGSGKGIARSLEREGCKVALTDTRADLLEAVAQDIRREFGIEAAWWTGDLLKTEDANRVVQQAADHFGRIDILVNNAGSAAGGVLESLSDEAWEAG